MAELTESERKDIRADFRAAVNLPPSELQGWLETDASKAVGDADGDGESTGHASGRRILAILDKTVDELDDDDHEHMRKVVGYVNRHLAQGGPEDDVEDSRWRHSLMNWGHDPLR
jgi:hypothetical protein